MTVFKNQSIMLKFLFLFFTLFISKNGYTMCAVDTSSFIKICHTYIIEDKIASIFFWSLDESQLSLLIQNFNFQETTKRHSRHASSILFSDECDYVIVKDEKEYRLFSSIDDFEIQSNHYHERVESFPILWDKDSFDLQKKALLKLLDFFVKTELDYSVESLSEIDSEFRKYDIRQLGYYQPAILIYIGEVYLKEHVGEWGFFPHEIRSNGPYTSSLIINASIEQNNNVIFIDMVFNEVLSEVYGKGFFLNTCIYEIL